MCHPSHNEGAMATEDTVAAEDTMAVA